MEVKDIYKRFLLCGKVEIDTRKIKGDCIYFALKGERFDGNDFVIEALEKGACYVITEREIDASDDRIIVVKDSLKTLQNLARHHRQQFSIPFFAITGSNGKTTTKELVASILSSKYNVHSTAGNFNNHIGVPLTLLSMQKDTEIAIIEMGASKLGDIKELCFIAEPTHGMITNIGHAHLEGFGSFENVKKGKAELYDFLCNEGLVFVNKQEEFLSDLLCKEQRIHTWIMHPDDKILSDYRFECLKEIPVTVNSINGNAKFILKTLLNGYHNYKNVISAITIGLYFDIPIKDIIKILSEFTPASNRSETIIIRDTKFILDAYNANPTSMRASLLAFSKIKSKKKVVVLGDMMELGAFSEDSHNDILKYALELGFNKIVTVGKHFNHESAKYPNIINYLSISKLMQDLSKFEWKECSVLLKGSRALELETILKVF